MAFYRSSSILFDLAVPIWVEHRFEVYCDINPIAHWLFKLNPVMPSLHITANKRLRYASPKLPLATSFIRKTLSAMPDYKMHEGCVEA